MIYAADSVPSISGEVPRLSAAPLSPVVEANLLRPRFDSVSTFGPSGIAAGRAFFF